MVRGLALRSLCSLRLESILEYVDKPLSTCLGDISAYVRKTAVLGVLKIYNLSPALVETNGYVQRLYSMLQDVDANVVMNVIHVISELRLSEGGFEITQSTIMPILNRIGEFSEWGLNTILDLLARYKPHSEDELYAIMNLLDPVLRTANSGSVLATLKVFLFLASSLGVADALHPQILVRCRPPLLTLVTGAHSEVQYVTLKHLQCLLQLPAATGLFDTEHRSFFVRYNEAPHVKHLKVDVLAMIACSSNAREIAAELTEYVTDVDSELSKHAVQALASLAMRVTDVSEEMTRLLLSLMDADNGFIRAKAAVALVDVLRVLPVHSDLLLPYLGRYLRKLDSDPVAQAAFVWVLGEFGARVEEAPYLLETLIDDFDEQPSREVKAQVLTAAMKLFFARPAEMQHMLGRLLSQALNEGGGAGDQDLHDRALLCYRLLRTNLTTAEAVFATGAAVGRVDGDFAEQREVELKRKVWAEFNTLAVPFNQSSNLFIADKYQLKLENAPVPDFEVVVPNAHSRLLGGDTTAAAVTVATAPSSTSDYNSGAAAVAPMGTVNLLDWDEAPSSSSYQPAALPVPQQQVLLGMQFLDPNQMSTPLSPPVFQQLWTEWPEAFNGRLATLTQPPLRGGVSEVETALRAGHVAVMASGSPSPSEFKFFVYGAEATTGAMFLAQLVLVQGTDLQVALKLDGSLQTRGVEVLRGILAALQQFAPVEV